jgi:Acyl-CoA synthetases (AMP-forming)/AMP-acid ligases II
LYWEYFLLFDQIGGWNTLFFGLRKSLHLVAPSNRNPPLMAELIEKYSVRVLPCSPTFLNMMDLDGIFNDFSMKSLRLITYGTERMPEQLLNRLSTKLPRVKFLQTFGTSETGIVQTKSLSSSSTFLTIDDPKVEWKIENNELWIKSSSQISGYINTTEKAIDDGWFKTGDLVESKNDNYFRIIGRKNEVINVGGEKVLPSEIEDFVMTIDGIQDCTAFSVSNGITGQAVGIKVVARESSDIKSLKKEIRKNSRLKLESFKIPVKIIFESKLNHTDRFKKKR